MFRFGLDRTTTNLHSKEPVPVTDTNITRAEAMERSALVAVTSYDVHVDLSDVKRLAPTYPSTTTVHFTAVAGMSTWIDLIAPGVRRAVLNGVELDPATFTGSRLPLPSLRADNVLVIEADCAFMRTGEGLHRFVDPVDSSVYLGLGREPSNPVSAQGEGEGRR